MASEYRVSVSLNADPRVASEHFMVCLKNKREKRKERKKEGREGRRQEKKYLAWHRNIVNKHSSKELGSKETEQKSAVMMSQVWMTIALKVYWRVHG